MVWGVTDKSGKSIFMKKDDLKKEEWVVQLLQEKKMGTTLNPPTTPSVFNGLIFEVVESNSFEQILLLTCWQAAQNYFAVSKGCTKKF